MTAVDAVRNRFQRPAEPPKGTTSDPESHGRGVYQPPHRRAPSMLDTYRATNDTTGHLEHGPRLGRGNKIPSISRLPSKPSATTPFTVFEVVSFWEKTREQADGARNSADPTEEVQGHVNVGIHSDVFVRKGTHYELDRLLQ